MTFEFAYHVDGDSMDLSRFSDVLKQKKVLMFNDPGESVTCLKANHIPQIVQFLRKHLFAQNKAVIDLIRPEPLNNVVPLDDAPTPPKAQSTESWPPQRSAKDLLEHSDQPGRKH
jgi:hypothetical protein